MLSGRGAVVSAIATVATLATIGVGAVPSLAADHPTDSVAVHVVTDAAATTGRGTSTVSINLMPAVVLGRRPPSVRGSGTFDFAKGRGAVRLQGSSGTERVVFLPQAMFIRQPPPTSGASPLPAGRSWVSAGLNESPGTGSGLPLFVDQVEVVNAGLILDEIRWGATAARPLGTGQIGGVDAQGYTVSVNLRQAQSSARGPEGRALARVVDYQVQALASKNSSSATVRVKVWVASNGRVTEVEWSPPGGGVGTTSITMSGHPGRLRISAPPPSQTVDVATLSPAGEKEGGLGDVA